MLVHPRTRAAITFDEQGRLSARNANVPTFGGVPCLFVSPDVVEAWREMVDAFVTTAAENQRRLEAAADRMAALPLSRARLETMGAAWRDTRAEVASLFAGDRQDGPPPPISEAERNAAAMRFMEGYGLLMRDWCGDEWAEREISLATANLLSVVPTSTRVERLLVLGAGGARMTLEAARALSPRLTVALDINPLPFAIANRLFAGQCVTLHEFPMNPASPDDAAVIRKLSLRGPRPERVLLIFADARLPPVEPGLFDAVLTPWYVDQVAQPLPQIVDTLAALLPRGGLWLNQGPLIYGPRTPVELRMTFAELRDLCERRGFVVENVRTDRVPHLQSPSQTSGRVEEVYTFAARRI